MMIDAPPTLFAEINSVKTSDLTRIYKASLSHFLTAKDINKLLIEFKSPEGSILGGPQRPNWKSLSVSYGSRVFSCRLQSFPGCCGFLVMSDLYRTGFPPAFLEPIFKSIFNFTNSLNYQCVFTSHVSLNVWHKILKDLFDDARETGKNKRTGNMLVLYYKNVSERLPTQIYTLPKQPNDDDCSFDYERV